MRKVYLFLFLFSHQILADVLLNSQDIKQACEQHAYSVIKEMDKRIVKMNSDQQSDAVDLAYNTCLDNFIKAGSTSENKSDGKKLTEQNDAILHAEEESEGWLDKLLESDEKNIDRGSNKRLKKQR